VIGVKYVLHLAGALTEHTMVQEADAVLSSELPGSLKAYYERRISMDQSPSASYARTFLAILQNIDWTLVD
jgi:hypothetical protein